MICEVYDAYAIARNMESGAFERVYYTKNDENDSLVVDKTEVCYIVDVNETEKEVLNALAAAHGSYEKVQESFEEITQKNSELTTKFEEQGQEISTLIEEKTNIANELTEANTKFESLSQEYEELKSENESLNSFKKSIEKAEKENIINQYSDKIDSEVLNTFSENLEQYSEEDLRKELAYAFVQSNAEVFSNGYYPKDEPKGGIEEILSKY